MTVLSVEDPHNLQSKECDSQVMEAVPLGWDPEAVQKLVGCGHLVALHLGLGRCVITNNVDEWGLT